MESLIKSVSVRGAMVNGKRGCRYFAGDRPRQQVRLTGRHENLRLVKVPRFGVGLRG